MKNKGFRFRVLITLLVSLIVGAGQAQAFEPLPPRLDGTMMPLHLDIDQPLDAAVPDSLTPIFVDYLGRHGARYLSSSKKVDKLMQKLSEAADKGQLSVQGESFMKLLERVTQLTGGRWGALDSIGMIEQQTLARQMHSLFPELLKKGRVTAEATYVPRVVMSMYEFCHTLGAISPDLEIYTSEGKQNNDLLRYFDANKEYAAFLADGDWKSPLDTYESEEVAFAPAARLFKEGYGLSDKELRKLTLDMYGVLQSLRATGMGVPTTEWMTEGEYASCWRASNLEHYLRRVDTPISCEPGRAASPLLESFIAYADSAVGGRDVELKARLRFGHAETLMPLLSLMHIGGCDAMTDDYSALPDLWKDYEVVPLGANVLVAILRGPSGRCYAAIRVNGEWKAPLADGRLCVGWDELRTRWMSYMENIGSAKRTFEPSGL